MIESDVNEFYKKVMDLVKTNNIIEECDQISLTELRPIKIDVKGQVNIKVLFGS